MNEGKVKRRSEKKRKKISHLNLCHFFTKICLGSWYRRHKHLFQSKFVFYLLLLNSDFINVTSISKS